MVQRDAVDLHGHCRHHIRRFLVEDEVVQSLDVNLLVAYDVGGDELSTVSTFLIEGLHRSVLDTRELTDDGFHLFQLDTEAADLHLSVSSTHKLYVARRQVAYDVARAIDTHIFLILGEWVADIHLCGFLRTVQVATAHLWTGNPEFASGADGQAMTLWVDHIKTHVVEGLADGYLLHLLVYFEGCGENGALCRTVYINEIIASGRGERCQLLTSGGEVFQRMVLDAGGKLIAHLCCHE